MKPLITHRFPFTEANAAFETTKKGVGPDGKLAIKTISKFLAVRNLHTQHELTYAHC